MIYISVVNSILNGELRPNIICGILNDKDVIQRTKILRKTNFDECQIGREAALIEALDGILPLSEDYDDFRKMLQTAEKCRGLFFTDESQYTPMSPGYLIGGVFASVTLATPLLQFYDLLLQKESWRTLIAINEIHLAHRDDEYVCVELEKLLESISHLLKQAQRDLEGAVRELVLQSLVYLHFSLQLAYKELLGEDARCDIYDFGDMVYEVWGRYPCDEEKKNYEDYLGKVPTVSVGNRAQEVAATPAANDPSSKTMLFLQRVEERGLDFMGVPMIKALGSEEKVWALLDTALEKPGHACAMLEHVGFYDYIDKNRPGGYKRCTYDKDMTYALGLEGDAFSGYRKSLNPKRKNTIAYPAYIYKEQSGREYESIKKKKKKKK